MISFFNVLFQTFAQFWIGLNDKFREGQWFFTDMRRLRPELTGLWADNEPNNKDGKEHCVMWPHGSAGKWNDAKCNNKYSFICEIELFGKYSSPPGPPPPPGGGGTHLSTGRGGGWKPDPVSNRSAHKKYTLSQYTLLKTFICIPCMYTGTDGLSILLCIIIHS